MPSANYFCWVPRKTSAWHHTDPQTAGDVVDGTLERVDAAEGNVEGCCWGWCCGGTVGPGVVGVEKSVER